MRRKRRLSRQRAGERDYKGYAHHASVDDPQYEIKSDKTDHLAIHKGAALKKTHA